MKKRLRKTGEIVDVIGFRADKGKERDWEDYVHYKTSDTLVTGINGLNLYQDFEDVKEELTKEIDWEQRRYEAAKTVIHAQIAAPIIPGVDPNPSIPDLVKRSVLIADALISELKKGERAMNTIEHYVTKVFSDTPEKKIFNNVVFYVQLLWAKRNNNIMVYFIRRSRTG